MPEAVIVSAARSPIGRAGKGSLKEMRPDEMASQMVRSPLAGVPGLDPAEITDRSSASVTRRVKVATTSAVLSPY